MIDHGAGDLQHAPSSICFPSVCPAWKHDASFILMSHFTWATLQMASPPLIYLHFAEWVIFHNIVKGKVSQGVIPFDRPAFWLSCLLMKFCDRGMFHKASPPGGGRAMTLPAMLPVLSKTPGSTRCVTANNRRIVLPVLSKTPSPTMCVTII